jgi:hypothetical protein
MTDDTTNTTKVKVKHASININKELDARFRKCINMATCQKRGNRKECCEAAITDWCDKIENKTT